MNKKICKICSNEKEIISFPPKGRVCKSCKNAKSKDDYAKNPEKKLASSNNYYKNNKEKVSKRNAENSDYRKKYMKEWRSENVEKVEIYSKDYKESNKLEIKEQRAEYRKDNKEKINRYQKEYYSKPLNKIIKNVRRRLSDILQLKDLEKQKSFNEYIGCTPEFLKTYIEGLFQEGMTWNNYGNAKNQWNIDHLIPIGLANNAKQAQELNFYKNLRPAWSEDNFKKNNLKSDYCWQKLKRDIAENEDKLKNYPINIDLNEFIFQNEQLTSEHREFIEKYEWLGTIGYNVKYCFTARYAPIESNTTKIGDLAGIVMLAEPNAYQFGDVEALIQRGACSSWAPKNLNSKLVMFACNWMVRNTNKRIFTAYSDPQAGEIGTIYQACNFDYLGQEFGATNYYILENEKKVSSRWFTKTSIMKKWAKELNIEWKDSWINQKSGYQIYGNIPQELKDYANNKRKMCKKIKQASKGKYVLLLNYGKNKAKKTWESKPYPKR